MAFCSFLGSFSRAGYSKNQLASLGAQVCVRMYAPPNFRKSTPNVQTHAIVVQPSFYARN